MKRLLILIDKIGERSQQLADASHADIATFKDVAFYLGEDVQVWVGDKKIDEYKLIYIRRADHDLFQLAGSLGYYFEKKHIKYFDKAFSDIGAAGNKLNAYLKLYFADLPIIPTFYCQQDKVAEYKDIISEKIGFPIVAKEVSSQRGRVYKLESLSDIDKLPQDNYRGTQAGYLFQKFIDIEEEYRLLVLGYSIGAWEEKIIQKKGEFRHNAVLGAKEVFMDTALIPNELRNIALKSARVLSLHIAGVDVLKEKKTGKFYFLEVNRGPGLTYDTNISPEFPQTVKFLREQAK